MNGKRGRDEWIKFRVSPEEYSLIQQKLALSGIRGMSAFLRKMAIDGYIIKLELPELREMVSLLKRSSNNLNQIARRVNATQHIYSTDLEDMLRQQEELWQSANVILRKLEAIAQV